MISAPFDYVRPSSLQEATDALRAAGEDAKVLAGGQSLLPLLRLRLSYPEILIDLDLVPELHGVSVTDDDLFIGAMTTHYEIINDPAVQAHCPLLATATATVADPAVRHRGTFGGALAHADPAGDLPAVVLALDGVFVTTSREIPAADFFVDYLTSALEPAEILIGVRISKSFAGWGCHYEKFHRTAQSWATIGVAALVNGTQARVGLTNMGATPLRATAVEQAIAGGADPKSASAAAAEGTDPPDDLHGSAEYRSHLATVLTARALTLAAGG
jgi:aerobic carbon-monoxide dehydrogenase medium subunit